MCWAWAHPRMQGPGGLVRAKMDPQFEGIVSGLALDAGSLEPRARGGGGGGGGTNGALTGRGMLSWLVLCMAALAALLAGGAF